MHVISIAKDTFLPDECFLFTLDVTSLYTCIPHDEGIAAVGRAFINSSDPRRPDLTLLSMLRLLLHSNDFVFDNKRYHQTHGTMMGGAFGWPYSSIFLHELEQRILSLPKCCLLYTSPSPRDLSTSRMPSSA